MGKTALMIAKEKGNKEVVTILMEKAAAQLNKAESSHQVREPRYTP